MQTAIKLNTVSETTATTLSSILYDFLDGLGYHRQAEAIEHTSRSGFIPHSWNHGGWQNRHFTTIAGIIGSGIYPGGKKSSELIDKYYNEAYNEIVKDNPDLAEDSDEFYELLDEVTGDDYSSVMVNTQVRFKGYENGLYNVEVATFICITDAPYHRSVDDELCDNIEAETLEELKEKLEQIEADHINFMNLDY